MKRKRTTPSPDQGDIKWIKNGGGTFRLKNGKIVKTNEIFSAPESEIPVAFRDNIVPVGHKFERTKKTSPRPRRRTMVPDPVTVEPLAYQVQENDNGFCVVDESGKQVSEDFGTREEAEEVLAVLGS